MKNILDTLPNSVHKEFQAQAEFISVPAKTLLVSEGDILTKIPFVINGRVRVYKEDKDSERELLLYHVRAAQTCFMSIVSGIRGTKSKVEASTCVDSELVFIPVSLINKWGLENPEWTAFVLDAFMDRYCELVDSLESMTFDRVEVRIEKFLQKQALLNKTNTIKMTHQKLANSIGTTRVVISRLLKKLEQEKKIRLHKGKIIIQS
jgi:CRP/FNR family transcriptional regulator